MFDVNCTLLLLLNVNQNLNGHHCYWFSSSVVFPLFYLGRNDIEVSVDDQLENCLIKKF